MAAGKVERIMALLPIADVTRLKVVALVGSDADLPLADKRSRLQMLPTLTVIEGQLLRAGEIELRVLSPGRGRDTVLCGWQETIDGKTVDCVGTFFESQVRA